MKWIGWAGGQKWFKVPLYNMDIVGDQSPWNRGHCLLCVCPARNITELHPIAWAPWACWKWQTQPQSFGNVVKDNSFFDLDIKAAICISVSLSWSLLTALSVQL